MWYKAQAEEKKKPKETQSKFSKPPIYRIVLTGGPCGGKTTALAFLSERLRSLGFNVYTVPETATILISGGNINFATLSDEEVYNFQVNLIKTMMTLEDSFYRLAVVSGKPSILLLDRGIMDASAYIKKSSWDVLLDEEGWKVVDLRDRRYDLVIHLVTAAVGAEKFYTLSNNVARSEDLSQAIELDKKTINAWVGHPSLAIIDNSVEFNDKIKRVFNYVSRLVGVVGAGNSKRYILAPISIDKLLSKPDIKVETFEVEQVYLSKNNESSYGNGYAFVRRRGQNSTYSYTYITREIDKVTGVEKAQSRVISGRDYLSLLKQADNERIPLSKTIYCFQYENVYYEIESINNPQIGLFLLTVESDKEKINLPNFLNIEAEVTNSSFFNSYNIAKDFKNRNIDWKKDVNLYEDYKKNLLKKD